MFYLHVQIYDIIQWVIETGDSCQVPLIIISSSAQKIGVISNVVEKSSYFWPLILCVIRFVIAINHNLNLIQKSWKTITETLLLDHIPMEKMLPLFSSSMPRRKKHKLYSLKSTLHMLSKVIVTTTSWQNIKQVF